MSDTEHRIAAIAVVVEDTDSVEALNAILHEFGDIIFGRMGVPHRERGVNVITLAVDALQDDISALSGRIGALEGVSVSIAYAKQA